MWVAFRLRAATTTNWSPRRASNAQGLDRSTPVHHPRDTSLRMTWGSPPIRAAPPVPGPNKVAMPTWEYPLQSTRAGFRWTINVVHSKPDGINGDCNDSLAQRTKPSYQGLKRPSFCTTNGERNCSLALMPSSTHEYFLRQSSKSPIRWRRSSSFTPWNGTM